MELLRFIGRLLGWGLLYVSAIIGGALLLAGTFWSVLSWFFLFAEKPIVAVVILVCISIVGLFLVAITTKPNSGE